MQWSFSIPVSYVAGSVNRSSPVFESALLNTDSHGACPAWLWGDLVQNCFPCLWIMQPSVFLVLQCIYVLRLAAASPGLGSHTWAKLNQLGMPPQKMVLVTLAADILERLLRSFMLSIWYLNNIKSFRCKTYEKLWVQETVPKYLNPSIDSTTIGLHGFNPRGVVAWH